MKRKPHAYESGSADPIERRAGPSEPDRDIESAWAAEIERRARRVLAGEGELEDWESIRERLRPRSR